MRGPIETETNKNKNCKQFTKYFKNISKHCLYRHYRGNTRVDCSSLPLPTFPAPPSTPLFPRLSAAHSVTARSYGHGTESKIIYSTNHSAQNHCSTNQIAWTASRTVTLRLYVNDSTQCAYCTCMCRSVFVQLCYIFILQSITPVCLSFIHL